MEFNFLDYDEWFACLEQIARKDLEMPEEVISQLDFINLREYFYRGYSPREVVDSGIIFD